MKLYYSKGACSFAERIIINELGIDCAYESVDLRSKKTESGNDFLQINPKGAIPVLEIASDEVLTENAVILQYLADKKHATNLLPPIDDLQRYRVLEWLNYVATDMHKSIGALFNPKLSQEMKDNITIPLIKSKLNYVNAQMENRSYLLGDEFTLPDAYMTVMLMWLQHFKFDMATTWPNIARYFATLVQRPAIKKSMQEEGLA